jgi:hypothetical protein
MAYSDGEVAEALVRLAVNRYDYDLTAEQTGVSVKTLRRWDKSAPKKGVADLLERALERLLSVIPENMDGNDWAIAVGILLDKWLLLQGEATSRHESISRVLDDLDADDYASVVAEAERIIADARTG